MNDISAGRDVTVTIFSGPTLAGDVSAPEAAALALQAKIASGRWMSPQTNLPAFSSSFIGRTEQVREWCALLWQGKTRLLTITGLGGMGKTRTALRIAEMCATDFAPHFPDGVWWVPLAQVRENSGQANFGATEDILRSIAAVLPLPQDRQKVESVKKQLQDFLKQRKLLLVLDNLEQIHNTAQRVICDLLMGASKIQCLVTSRRELEISGLEKRVEITSLPLSDAVTLLLEEVRKGKTGDQITEGETPHIQNICQRLECIPLALELVAPLFEFFTPEAVLDHLSDRLGLSRTSLNPISIHPSLDAMLDWSYTLLAPTEQALLRQLSVFNGSFTLSLAREICQGEFEAFNGIKKLQSHSLLRSSLETTNGHREWRFFLLETVREYATKKLKNAEPVELAVRQRHALYFAEYGEHVTAKLRTRDADKMIGELNVNEGNLRSALAWATQQNQHKVAAQIYLSLYHLLYAQGLWSEARQQLQMGWKALEKITLSKGAAAQNCAAVNVLRGHIGFYLADVTYDVGQFDEARQLAQANLTLRQDIKDVLGAARTLNLLGLIDMDDGQLETARKRFEEALRNQPDTEHIGRGITLHNLARLFEKQRDFEAAERLYRECLSHREIAGDSAGSAKTLGNLGWIAQTLGEGNQADRVEQYAKAYEFYRKSLALSYARRDHFGMARMLHNLGDLYSAREDFTAAIKPLIHARRIFQSLPSPCADVTQELLEFVEARLGKSDFDALCHKADEVELASVVAEFIPQG